MLNQTFYHALTRKYIEAFGGIFNDITFIRYNNSGQELKRMKVPIFFGPREKWLVHLNEKGRKVNVTLPLMSYNMTGMSYNPEKKLNALHKIPRANNISGNADTMYNGVPYILDFELSILARNKDDAWQILEQIIPSFHPHFTFSQIVIPEVGNVQDIPVTLKSINTNINGDSDFDEISSVEITLSFTMHVNYYGPVATTKIIRRVFANTFIDPSLYAGALVRVNLANGNNGIYRTEDLVYQGENEQKVTAAGIVHTWNPTNQYLIIGGVQGDFKTNTAIKAASTNAIYTLTSFDMSPLKVQSIKIEPDPIDAEPNGIFGYTETLTEFPYTLTEEYLNWVLSFEDDSYIETEDGVYYLIDEPYNGEL